MRVEFQNPFWGLQDTGPLKSLHGAPIPLTTLCSHHSFLLAPRLLAQGHMRAGGTYRLCLWSVSPGAPLSLPQPQHSSLLKGFQAYSLGPPQLAKLFPKYFHKASLSTPVRSLLKYYLLCKAILTLHLKWYQSLPLTLFPAFIFSIAHSSFNKQYILLIHILSEHLLLSSAKPTFLSILFTVTPQCL